MDPLNLGLEVIMGWTKANKLKLNPDKMEVFMVGQLLISHLLQCSLHMRLPLQVIWNTANDAKGSSQKPDILIM